MRIHFVICCDRRLSPLFLLMVVRAVGAVVGGNPVNPPDPDAAVVFIQKYGYAARIEGLKYDKYNLYSFYGLRYALPPVGERRFQRPIRNYIKGDEAALRPCLPCPQLDFHTDAVIGNEDCLCLNIYAPKLPDGSKGCPVIIFLHGGGYKTGSAVFYGGKYFVQQNVVLVTVQYRLGLLGFLTTDQKEAGGNLGLFDMHLAREWVTDYIEFFGGDPNKVIIMGQGSGGTAASLLGMSRQGSGGGGGTKTGGVSGVVALSGAPLSPGAVRRDPRDTRDHARILAARTACPHQPSEALLMCLRQLPFQAIIKDDKNSSMELEIDTERFLSEITGNTGPGVRVEGEDDHRGLPPIVEAAPVVSLKQKQTCPILLGVTSAETSRAVHGRYAEFLTKKLDDVNDFIKNEVVGNLRTIVEGVGGLVPRGHLMKLDKIAAYYQSFFENSLDIAVGLSKVAEATTDALFNLPAYQSVYAWSNGGAPAFLFSFEHLGNLTRGSHFLPGVALADSSTVTEKKSKQVVNGPAHGDDLAFLFEPMDVQGNPIPEASSISDRDAKVRDAFVGLIVQFARGHFNEKSQNAIENQPFSSFEMNNNKYIKIGDEITTSSNFRFCQMGFWGNFEERLETVICKNIFGSFLQSVVAQPTQMISSAMNGLMKTEQKLPNNNALVKEKQPVQKNNNKKKPFLFDI